MPPSDPTPFAQRFTALLDTSTTHPANQWLALALPAPCIAAPQMCEAPLNGERTLFQSGNGRGDQGHAALVIGFGAAKRFTAEGPNRFDLLQRQLRDFWPQVARQNATSAAAQTSLCAMGGAAFFAHPSRDDAWAPFANAEFTLPRWSYLRHRDTATLIALLSPTSRRTPDAFLSEAQQLSRWLEAGTTAHRAPFEAASPAVPLPQNDGLSQTTDDAAQDAALRQLIADALAQIHNAQLEKVVISQATPLPLHAPPRLSRIVAHLLAHHPQSHIFALERSPACFVGATPERLATVTGKGTQLYTDVLAGTWPRTPDGRHDAAEIAALRACEKNRREFAHVKRTVAQTVAQLGGAVQSEDTGVRTLTSIHHLHAPITATFADRPVHILDAVATLHPTSAVCGIPSQAAADWLKSHEPHERGWYAGPVGWCNPQGDGEAWVGIRSALLHGKTAVLYAGGGIIAGSEPEAEVAEIRLKQSVMRQTIEAT
ncbi:MAG: isochorismate synthase [Myxococcales bacterium]|nr:isochorismate synthase [Myxococcales bacterium]